LNVQRTLVIAARDVAGVFIVNEKTIYSLAQQEELPGFKVAETWRLQLQDIQGSIDEKNKRVTTN